MNYKELTSPCGIDCFNCQIYEKNITENMKQELSGILKKNKEEVICKGCRKEGKCVLYSHPCDTLECAKTKGVEYCFECFEFPCERLNPCLDKADKYPHNLKIFNLCMISKVGIEKWAEETKKIRVRYFSGKFVSGRGSCQGPNLK